MRKQQIIMAGVVAATAVVVPGGVAQAADGDEWRAIRPIVTLPERDLRDVEAVSATEVWIAGYQYSSASAYFPILQRWNGRNWRAYDPKGIGFEGRLYDLSAVGPNDVWVAGVREEDDETGLTETYLGHWDGSAWSMVDAPPANEAGGSVRRVAADGGGVWLADAGGRVSRWDGTSWTTHLDLGEPVYALESFASGDAWLRTESAVHHWDGTAWSQVALPEGALVYQVQITEQDGAWVPTPAGLLVWGNGSWQETPFPDGYQNRSVTGLSAGHWIRLGGGGEWSWLRWTGSGWFVADRASGASREVTADSAGRVWGVDGVSVAVPFDPQQTRLHSGKLIRYRDGEWETVSGLPRANYILRAIPGTDKTIGVGVDGITGDLKAITNG
ncbi:hypothetical protein [Actinocorallia libanotica]